MAVWKTSVTFCTQVECKVLPFFFLAIEPSDLPRPTSGLAQEHISRANYPWPQRSSRLQLPSQSTSGLRLFRVRICFALAAHNGVMSRMILWIPRASTSGWHNALRFATLFNDNKRKPPAIRFLGISFLLLSVLSRRRCRTFSSR